MHRPRIPLLLSLAMSLAGCLSTRLANIENLDVPLPRPNPSAGWQAETAALLELYESAPVLAAEDERLDPLYGGCPR